MSEPEKEVYYPEEKNMGRNCRFWDLKGRFVGCNFPKFEMQGRLSCEGTIDDVCLNLMFGRPLKSLTEEQIINLRTRIPGPESNRSIPPGDTKP